MTMKARGLLVLAALAATGFVAGASTGSDTGTSPSTSATTPTPAAQPGNPDVYTRIAALTSCPDLQHEFDLAEATHRRGGSWGPIGTAYMRAADTRMRTIGCY
jgi:hypothetical protein